MTCPFCRLIGFQSGHLCVDCVIAWAWNYVVPMCLAVCVGLWFLRWMGWG